MTPKLLLEVLLKIKNDNSVKQQSRCPVPQMKHKETIRKVAWSSISQSLRWSNKEYIRMIFLNDDVHSEYLRQQKHGSPNPTSPRSVFPNPDPSGTLSCRVSHVPLICHTCSRWMRNIHRQWEPCILQAMPNFRKSYKWSAKAGLKDSTETLITAASEKTYWAKIYMPGAKIPQRRSST